MCRVIDVELQGCRGPLRAGPERRAGRRDLVRGKVVQQLRDGVVEALLELESSPSHTILVRRRPLVDQVRFHSHSRIELRIGLAVQLGGEGVVAGLEELVDVVGDLLEGALEPVLVDQ